MNMETIVSLMQYFSRTTFVFCISSSETLAASVKNTMAARNKFELAVKITMAT